MIEALAQRTFHLSTVNTSYILRITDTGHAEHLYYGRKLRNVEASVTAMREKHYTAPGMGTYTDPDFPSFVLDDAPLEMTTEGRGDYRIPLAAISLGEDGERTFNPLFLKHRISKGTKPFGGLRLPQAKDAFGDAETLELIFSDRERNITLGLVYTLFPALDVIVRRSVLTNASGKTLRVRSLASAQLDFRETGMKALTLHGTWGREMEKDINDLTSGTFISESRMLGSSAEANPGFMVTDARGGCYALNLIYPGPHRASMSVTEHGITHIVWGINPDMFTWVLKDSETFESPEAVMTFSSGGIEAAGDRIKGFIAAAIMRSSWSGRMRPVMLDTWEALGYATTENRIEELAKGAEAMGCEGVLINDGWFGARSSDRTSLGDWHVNTVKIPSGLSSLSDSIHRRGLLFGLWFEPEGVSRRSLLAKEHPEWIIGRSAETNAEGSHEQLLDITRYDVQDWIISTISKLADVVHLDYLRWNISRNFSDLFTLSGIRDYGMYAHEYAVSLCKILSAIGERFPDMYIETAGCARFDLGMLSISASIIPSEVSDPIERARLMSAASLMYPQAVIGTIVSPSPNAVTRRIVDRETRFAVAAFGVLSYSLDPSSFSKSEMTAFRQQTEFYKAYRLLLQTGRFRVAEDGNRTIWTVSNEDRSVILLLYLQHLIRPNTTAEKLRVPDANEEYDYRIFSRDHTMTEMESSMYPQENECYTVPGDTLKWAGISLAEQVSGTGYREGMRMLGDFSSRLYIIRRIDN